jgi:hypothetical protein
VPNSSTDFVTFKQLSNDKETFGKNGIMKFFKEHNLQNYMNQLIIIDYLIGNYNRTFNDMGFLVNADTMEYIAPAPIFDYEESLDIEMEDEYQPNEEYPQQQHQHGGHHHQPGTIELTKEEFEAVQRLKVLGNFTEDEAVQAYLACDKNEEHAANLLFESKYNDNHFQIKIIDNNNNNNNSQDQQKKNN